MATMDESTAPAPHTSNLVTARPVPEDLSTIAAVVPGDNGAAPAEGEVKSAESRKRARSASIPSAPAVDPSSHFALSADGSSGSNLSTTTQEARQGEDADGRSAAKRPNLSPGPTAQPQHLSVLATAAIASGGEISEEGGATMIDEKPASGSTAAGEAPNPSPSGVAPALTVQAGLGAAAGVAPASAPATNNSTITTMLERDPSLPQPPTVETAEAAAAAQPQQQAQTIQMRVLIVTQDASIIIGKGGKHINEIREKSGARALISEAVPGSSERILTVQGPLDAVSKAFGLVVRRINDEPFDVPSVPGSRAVTMRLIIPNARMGSVIGKSGSKIKEVQDMSGARLQASEALLPGSTERLLSVSGVADAVHIAVYYIGLILLENADRQPANTLYRPGRADGVGMPGPPAVSGMPGGMPGAPVARGIPGYGMSPPGVAYGAPPHHLGATPGMHHHHPGLAVGAVGAGNYGPGGYASTANAPGSQTQQIYIPNELVGSIIGKGGQKINEIRHLSGTHIKIMEPGEGGQQAGVNERLVTITGMAPNIQVAVSLLHQRLEQERTKQQMQPPAQAPM